MEQVIVVKIPDLLDNFARFSTVFDHFSLDFARFSLFFSAVASKPLHVWPKNILLRLVENTACQLLICLLGPSKHDVTFFNGKGSIFVEICGEIDGSKKFREIAKCFPSQDVEILIFNRNTYKNFV